jgi:hypothetical protein
MALRHVFLDLIAHITRDAFDLPHRRVESVSDRDQSVLVLGRVAMGPTDDDVFTLGHCDSNIDLEEIAFPMSGVRPSDHDMTARYPMAELFEALHLLGDLGSNLLRRLAVLKGDLDWHLHSVAPSSGTASTRC